MNRKEHKIFISLFFLSLLSFCCIADELVLNINNGTGNSVYVKFVDSNLSDKFETIEIPKEEAKKITTEFSDEYILDLAFTDQNNNRISGFQVFNKKQYDKNYQFYVPGGGSLTGWGCAWDMNRIKIKKLYGYKNYAWLNWVPLFSPNCYAEVNIEVIPEIKAEANNILEFTLFAVPKKDSIEEIELGTSGEKVKKLDKTDLNLQYWGLEEYASLKPAVHETGNGAMVRWVDLIIHNYTMRSFLFYGLEEDPGSDHIELAYKEGFLKDYTVFYPPQTQMRGPGFKFQAKNEKDNFILYPEDVSNRSKKDKYYLIIGKQVDLNRNDLDYIPLEITTGSRLGYALDNGVKLNAHEDYAYEVEFTPVNAQFMINTVEPYIVSEKIRVPLNLDGTLAFNIYPMENISIEAENPNLNINRNLPNRIAQKYIISGKSKTDGKKYSFRLLLIAPPFLAGNTPGRFYPGARSPITSDTGNFLRYPLHLYVMALDEENKEVNIDGIKTVSELPDNLIGSIEYFISDKDMVIKDDTDTEEN